MSTSYIKVWVMNSPFNVQMSMLESLANESILQMPPLRPSSSAVFSLVVAQDV